MVLDMKRARRFNRKRLRKLREKAGLSQQRLSCLLIARDLVNSRQAYQWFEEKAERDPGYLTVRALADILGCKPEDFYE